MNVTMIARSLFTVTAPCGVYLAHSAIAAPSMGCISLAAWFMGIAFYAAFHS